MTGMGYSKKEDGRTNWNSLANIKLGQYIKAMSYTDMVKSFNANTNDVSLPCLQFRKVSSLILVGCPLYLQTMHLDRKQKHLTSSCSWIFGHLARLPSLLFHYVCSRILRKLLSLSWNAYLICFKVVNGEREIFKFTGNSKAIQSLPQSIRNAFSYLFLSATWGFCIIEFRYHPISQHTP